MSDQSDEVLQQLDFLAEEFTFQREQLDVFLDKLFSAMNGSPDNAEEGK